MSPVPHARGPGPAPCPSEGSQPARPSPSPQAQEPTGLTLTFFPRHLGRKESPKEKEPERKLDPAPQLHAGRRRGLAPKPCLPSRLRPPSLGSCVQGMNLSCSLLAAAQASRTSLPGPQL